MPRALVLAAAFAAACGPRAPAPTTPTTPTTAADARSDDALHVDGNRLVRRGRAARLLGVSHSGSEYACVDGRGFFEGPGGDALTRALASWRIDTVRVPLNEDCWLGINGAPAAFSGAAYQRAIADRVALLRGAGMIVVLDLHWSAPGATLAKGQRPMADRDHAPAFWRSVAAAFARDLGVVFDLFNEPYLSPAVTRADPWECWRDGCAVAEGEGGEWQSAGMQELVDAVRSAGARNVVLVGGLDYANDMRGWLAHRPRDPIDQLAASFHVYDFNACNDSACWDALAPIAATVPLVTGELGEGDCAHGFIDRYMAWADARGASYLGWAWNTWDCKKGPALVAAYDGTPTPFGDGFKAHLLALPR